jgi:hypothetical protein
MTESTSEQNFIGQEEVRELMVQKQADEGWHRNNVLRIAVSVLVLGLVIAIVAGRGISSNSPPPSPTHLQN